MKTFILAALTVLSLGAGVANAQSYSHAAPGNTANSSWLQGGAGGGD